LCASSAHTDTAIIPHSETTSKYHFIVRSTRIKNLISSRHSHYHAVCLYLLNVLGPQSSFSILRLSYSQIARHMNDHFLLSDHKEGERSKYAAAISPHGLDGYGPRSEEHTSELQSRFELVCRPLLEKQNYSSTGHG